MHRMHNDPKTSSGPETTGRTIHWASQQGSIDAGVAPFELNLWSEAGLGRLVPAPLGRGGALPGVRDTPGQDPHGQLHLSGVPAT
jgi:hypothetical protein